MTILIDILLAAVWAYAVHQCYTDGCRPREAVTVEAADADGFQPVNRKQMVIT